MKIQAAALAALGLAFALVAGPSAAADGALSVKSGVDAATAGKCLANITVFDKMAQEVLEKDSPENKLMIEAWVSYIAVKDAAFVDTATQAITATGERYTGSMDDDGEALIAALAEDLGECVGYLQ